MNFKQQYQALLNELNQISPAPITTNPDKTEFSDEHQTGVRLEKKKDFLVHVFGQFTRELEQHYAKLQQEWETIDMKFSKAKGERKVSQDSIQYVDNLRAKIQRIKNVFRLENKA